MPTPPSDAVASPYHSGTRFDFAVGDHRFVIAQPAQPANGRPWIWRPEFFGAFDAKVLLYFLVLWIYDI